jgi:1,4-alpha-glucan branching enzyme
MKKIVYAFVCLSLWACRNEPKSKPMNEMTMAEPVLAPMTPAQMERAVIYEANIRQYSPEGTFRAFTEDLPKLKELGVTVIWLMPVYPISQTRRKATPELMVEDIADPVEREKYLGSYYAISDYRAINPEFGTIEDFRELVRTAHELGMYVILDWVANHTGWDHVWIQQHPDYYSRNAAGEITDPLQDDGTPWGWSDVADLNYDNPQMREDMIQSMLYWLKQENIDGFRCDVAATVPTWFWKEAIGRLRAEKDIFILAEAWEPELLEGELFDAGYGWDGHHLMNDIAKGHKSAHDWDGYMCDRFNKYGDDDFLMNFVDNHDENSWNGTVKERMGDGSEAFIALTYAMPGLPLIYSGLEYNLDHRLKFFEKDSIPHQTGSNWPLLVRLGELKASVPALEGGKQAASYERLATDDQGKVLAFRRQKDGSEVVFMVNLSDSAVEFNPPLTGSYTDMIGGDTKRLNQEESARLEPWEFVLLDTSSELGE